MNYEVLFQAANTFALLGWFFLLVLPRWQYSRRVVIWGNVLVLACCYTVLFLTNIATVNNGDGLMSLGGIIRAFQHPIVALIGWVHYLAFDMFVGAWEVQDAQAQGLSHWYVIPCLLGTFMAGPAGLLLYIVLRTIHARRMEV